MDAELALGVSVPDKNSFRTAPKLLSADYEKLKDQHNDRAESTYQEQAEALSKLIKRSVMPVDDL